MSSLIFFLQIFKNADDTKKQHSLSIPKEKSLTDLDPATVGATHRLIFKRPDAQGTFFLTLSECLAV